MNPSGGGYTLIHMAIISGLATILSPLIVFFLTVYFDSRKNKKKLEASFVDGMVKTQKVHSAMEMIVRDSSADRAIMFSGHNSGGLPRPSSPFWTSAMYWNAKNYQKELLLAEYQNLVVDARYIQMLIETRIKGQVTLDTSKMPECQLRRYYRAEGVEHAMIFYIQIVENKFIYLSVAKYSPEPFTEEEETKMQIRVDKIRSLFPI